MPPLLRVLFNLAAFVGVVATLMGLVNHVIGGVITVIAVIYFIWEIAPWVMRQVTGHPTLSLCGFAFAGLTLGVAVWWVLLTNPPKVLVQDVRIEWKPPLPIVQGTQLSSIQLNATAEPQGEGTITYSPDVGTVLPVGTHPLEAHFTPRDTTKYRASDATTMLVVNPAPPSTIPPSHRPPAQAGSTPALPTSIKLADLQYNPPRAPNAIFIVSKGPVYHVSQYAFSYSLPNNTWPPGIDAKIYRRLHRNSEGSNIPTIPEINEGQTITGDSPSMTVGGGKNAIAVGVFYARLQWSDDASGNGRHELEQCFWTKSSNGDIKSQWNYCQIPEHVSPIDAKYEAMALPALIEAATKMAKSLHDEQKIASDAEEKVLYSGNREEWDKQYKQDNASFKAEWCPSLPSLMEELLVRSNFWPVGNVAIFRFRTTNKFPNSEALSDEWASDFSSIRIASTSCGPSGFVMVRRDDYAKALDFLVEASKGVEGESKLLQ
jgi:hypothetical protein